MRHREFISRRMLALSTAVGMVTLSGWNCGSGVVDDSADTAPSGDAQAGHAPSTGGASGASGAVGAGGTSASGGATGAGGASGSSGATAAGGASGSSGATAAGGGTSGSGGGSGAGGADGGAPQTFGYQGSCATALPAQAALADVSSPTTVVGTGTAASCTYAALAAAIAKGGVITFKCGSAPVTIPVTATLVLPNDRNTVIDGGDTITLDGGSMVRILEWNSSDFMANTHVLTLQRLALVNGKATPTVRIPACDPPCSQGWDDGEGGALYMRDGALRAIGVTFANNQAADLGPDTGGGAVYLLGCQPAYIVGCVFKNNQASNAGAIGTLFATDNIYNSLFDGNKAVGNGANGDEPTKCACINNGQHQTGSGGNGGAIYSDGVAVDMTICGSTITNNTANEFGAAIFFTSNDASKKGTLTIRDSTLKSNKGNGIWEASPGISTNANYPAATNTTITP